MVWFNFFMDYHNHGFVADGPKTSEYAFFKKLKKDAGQKFDSHSMRREKNQSNKLNSIECREVVGTINLDIVLT